MKMGCQKVQKEVKHEQVRISTGCECKTWRRGRAAVVEKAKGYVTRYGGTVGEVEEWGKKRLAYEIQHMREAYYYFIQFEADATAPAEIESHMRIMDNVLRYLVVKKEA